MNINENKLEVNRSHKPETLMFYRDATERGWCLPLGAVAYLNLYQVTIVFEIDVLFISSLGCY